MSVKIKDIAHKAGVAVSTVSMALNGNETINSETRKKIEQIALDMGYVPNMNAQRLLGKGRKIVGLIVPDTINPFYGSLVQEFNECLRNAGYTIIISISQNSFDTENEIISEMIYNNVDGLVIVPIESADEHDTKSYEMLKKIGIPYIFMTSRYENIDAPYIISDFEGAMYNAVNYAHSLEYKNPVFVTGNDKIYSCRLKNKGFRRAISDIPEYEALSQKMNLVYTLDTINYAAACDMAKNMYRDNVETDVIFAVNDLVALGMINTFRNIGISIPDHVAIVSFDDSIYTSLSPVPLTSIKQNIHTMVKEAFTLISSLIEKNSTQDSVILLETEIKERESSINYHCKVTPT